MSSKIKMLMTACVLTAYVLSSAGCAAAWFLAGAGTAATAVAVMNENDKQKAKDD